MSGLLQYSSLQRLLHLTKSSEALRQSALLTAGTIVAGGIMAVAMIVASRTLGPEKFGIFSVSIAIMALLSKFMDLGLNQLIPRLLNRWHNDPEKAKDFLAQTLLWKIRLVGLTIVVGVLCVPFLTQFLNYPYPDMILLSVGGALILGLYEYIYLLLSSRHLFFLVNVMGISQAIIKVVGFIAIFLYAAGSLNGITIIYYLAPFVSALAIGWQFRDWMWVKPHPASSYVRKEMLKFLHHATVGVIAMTLISNVDVLLVQRYLNTFETGLYAGATRIASFIGFIAAAVGGVLNNRVSRYKDRQTLQSYLLKSLSLIALAAIGFIIYLPFARLSLVLTIGPEYIEGLTALVVLVFNAFLSLAIVPYISFFYAVDHPEYFSIGGVLQVIIIFVGNALLLPIFGINGAAWTKVAATICFGIFTIFYVRRALNKLNTEVG